LPSSKIICGPEIPPKYTPFISLSPECILESFTVYFLSFVLDVKLNYRTEKPIAYIIFDESFFYFNSKNLSTICEYSPFTYLNANVFVIPNRPITQCATHIKSTFYNKRNYLFAK
jgi:hypothetical protein